jgi:hypothetical protein
MSILRILCYNGSLVTWTAVSLTTAKFKPLILSFSGSPCPTREHVHSHDFIWLLLVACTILLHNRIHRENWKPCATRGPVYTLENFKYCGETCPVYSSAARTAQKSHLLTVAVQLLPWEHVYLRSRYSVTVVLHLHIPRSLFIVIT